jgi:hypothetical protein
MKSSNGISRTCASLLLGMDLRASPVSAGRTRTFIAPRRGSLLLETSAALLLLAALTTVCLQFLWAVSDQRRQLYTQLTATQEAANLLERTAALSWDELAGDAPAKLVLSAQARQALPEGRCEIHVEGPSGDPPSKRIVVTACWRPQPGGDERKVKLVAWRYKNP